MFLVLGTRYWSISFSIILIVVHSCYIEVLIDSWKLVLTLAVQKADGKIPWVKDLFVNLESDKIIHFNLFTIFYGKLFGTMLLLVFKSWIVSITSSCEVGDADKVFWLA